MKTYSEVRRDMADRPSGDGDSMPCRFCGTPTRSFVYDSTVSGSIRCEPSTRNVLIVVTDTGAATGVTPLDAPATGLRTGAGVDVATGAVCANAGTPDRIVPAISRAPLRAKS